MLSEPTYLAARMVAPDIEAHFAKHLALARETGSTNLALQPVAEIIEAVIDVAFWASLRREEGHEPKISIALLPPHQVKQPLKFGNKIRLTPHNLKKLSPAVETPGIHLGVWLEGTDLYIWGTTHYVPGICFVLEVIEPGLLVIKHSRVDGFGKYVNVAILKGDQIKLVDETNANLVDCPALVNSLMDMPQMSYLSNTVNVLVELAAAMRRHQRGGLVLIVPPNSNKWQESIVQPVNYPVEPPYKVIDSLMKQDIEDRKTLEWQDQLLQAIDIIGGFTAVDGATVITRENELLAFGVKVARSAISGPVDHLIVTEPVVGSKPCKTHPARNGGTRHLAAAQFVHDQHDTLALVASQDGNFTVFAWSEPLQMVHAHRIDVLLL
ncbi:putative sensor domain DACNV-containing protein [Mucilaginibacter sp. KACC 22063]|uniref:putative sensor domain DACNV-containing protein n=1 Tax=Mucilaginibacter sp. KACC 22063 TaxID=3025666 RepID=UPI0023668D58|nr:hypothetical protein [Mucilaginibacter sp. KACC 22063]WDF57032.1 hypothetical protein PQ461_08190 [Mucilaginibacter sp. KACC 22063]